MLFIELGILLGRFLKRQSHRNLHVLQCMIWLVEVGGYREVIPPVDDISAVFSKRSANLHPVSQMDTIDGHLVHDKQ